MLDVRAIRAQFPSLSMTLDDGRPCVFLDAPAGTQVPRRVAEAISSYFYTANANSGGAFLTSKRSDAAVLEARRAMADFLGAPGPENIVFGANMTTLTFAVSRAIGRALQPGDEILCTGLDHDGNVSPWLALEEERGLRVRFVDIVPQNGTLDLDDLERKLSSRTKIVAATFASNALGTINDVAAITRLAHQAGALSWIDAVHYAPHGIIDVQALDCDFLVCSAYKFFGPHIGILYGKRSHLETFSPYKVRPAPDEIPDRWETGTPNNECLAGVHAAVEYVASLAPGHGMSRREQIVVAMNEIRAYERELSSRLIGGLLELDGMSVYGIVDPEQFAGRAPTVACRLEGYTPRQVAERLGAEGIFVWDGNYYALEVMTRLGLEESGGAVRIGPVHYNTPDEIDRTLDVLRDMVLRRPSRR